MTFSRETTSTAFAGGSFRTGEHRAPAHIFLCLVAYYVEWHLRWAWAPLLFEDEERPEERRRRDPILPAKPSASAQAKKRSHETVDGFPVHSLGTLLSELASRTKVTYELRREGSHLTFRQVPEPTPSCGSAVQRPVTLPASRSRSTADTSCAKERKRIMRGTVLYGTRDIRFEDVTEPRIIKPTDAVIRLAATCVCGSDLWPYRGVEKIAQPTPMGHEYCGIVEEVGSAVKTVKPGQFVIGSFFASDNTCPNCKFGYQSSCHQRELVGGAQAPLLRVPLADGTLVPTPGIPSKEMVPSLLATSDVLGTGWFAADAANVKPGMTVAVVGDGAVGLLAILSAKQMGAERIIAMSRHKKRQKPAVEFGATDIVTERGDEGVARIKDLTKDVGADAVLECVGTEKSMMQAIHSTRPGGYVGYVGVPHDVELKGEELFFAHVHLHGGPAPVRRFLPKLIDLVWTEKINPGKVFDLALPLNQVAEGYRAMDERRAIKTLLQP